jgi:hypothetical protein
MIFDKIGFWSYFFNKAAPSPLPMKEEDPFSLNRSDCRDFFQKFLLLSVDPLADRSITLLLLLLHSNK